MDVEYEAEPEPFMSDVMLGWGMKSVVEDEAGKIIDRARYIAPYDDGDYVASLRVDTTTTDPFQFGPRVVGLAQATVEYAMDVESRHLVMTRAAGG